MQGTEASLVQTADNGLSLDHFEITDLVIKNSIKGESAPKTQKTQSPIDTHLKGHGTNATARDRR